MKKYAMLLCVLLTGCSLQVNSHSNRSSDLDDSLETIDVTDAPLQPLGCSGPVVLHTSGGRYILPVNNIDQINTYKNHEGDAIVIIDTEDTRISFKLLGDDSLARFDKLLDRVCF
jgi:hypothetical protein